MSDIRAEGCSQPGAMALVVQVAGFAIVGAMRTLISYAAYIALLLVAPYWVAFSVSYVAVLLASLVVNGKYVFKADVTVRRGVLYGCVYFGNYLLSLGILHVVIKMIGLSPPLAPMVLIPIMFPVNFVTERYVLTR